MWDLRPPRLLCFRVRGIGPLHSAGNPPGVEEFELAQVAVEHAQRLVGMGWINVRAEEIHVDDLGAPFEPEEQVARVLFEGPKE